MNFNQKSKKIYIEKKAFINGQYVDSIDGNIIKKTSPIDNRDLSGIAACNEKDVNFAVKVAKDTYNSRIWVNKSTKEKKDIMLKFAFLIEQNIEELAILDTLETGRSIKNYLQDSIPKAIETIRWFAEAIDKVYENMVNPDKNSFAMIIKEPLGVVGIITPWNDPLVVSAWKFAPALLMGNSIVIKPAEQSSLSIIKVASLAKKAGIPDGVFNIVPGYGNIAGKYLALNKDVRGLFFTGSTEVGKLLLKYSGESTIRKIGLECGGKSPFLVLDNCKHLEEAAKVLSKNIFYNQGQICSAPSRLIIHKNIKQEFLLHLEKFITEFIPSDPFDIKNEVGCMINEQQFNKVNEYIKIGIKEGANIVTDKSPSKGYCIKPIIFDNVKNDFKIAREEIFGPVLTIITVENTNEAITIANDSEYGLAASVWSDDINEAHIVSRLLEAGIVHINSYGDDDNSVPFGGTKQSGIGKDKSIYAFDEYSYTKTIWTELKNDW